MRTRCDLFVLPFARRESGKDLFFEVRALFGIDQRRSSFLAYSMTLALTPAVYALPASSATPEDGPMTQFISLVASSSASTADADADAPADNTRRVVHHLAHLTVLQITNVTESIPSYLLAVIMVLAVVLIFLLCWCALAPLSRFILFPAICTEMHTLLARRGNHTFVWPLHKTKLLHLPRRVGTNTTANFLTALSLSLLACRVQGLLLLHVPRRRRAPGLPRGQEEETRREARMSLVTTRRHEVEREHSFLERYVVVFIGERAKRCS